MNCWADKARRRVLMWFNLAKELRGQGLILSALGRRSPVVFHDRTQDNSVQASRQILKHFNLGF